MLLVQEESAKDPLQGNWRGSNLVPDWLLADHFGSPVSGRDHQCRGEFEVSS